MNRKKAQITMFIILGIIILAIVMLVLLTRSTVKDNAIQSHEIILSPIQNYVESCIRQVGEEAIIHIGETGGYFELPENSTTTSYHFYVNRSWMPKKEKVEDEMAKYMDEELFFCLRSFFDFRREGITIRQGQSRTNVKIANKKVIFAVNMPLKIERGITQTQLNNFNAEVTNIRLDEVYNLSRMINNEQVKNPDYIPIGEIIKWSIEKDMYVDIAREDDWTMIFTITDENSRIKNNPYKFSFANIYQVNAVEE